MRVLRVYLVTLIIMETIAIVTHFNELLSYTGSVILEFAQIFILAAAIVWFIKKTFR